MFNEKDYNTQRTKLILPEYGRNIQKMVEHAKSIEDRNERTKYAHFIVSIMGNMNPHLRDINDFKHKLWDHLALMANYEIDIDTPVPVPQSPNTEPPKIVPYNQHRLLFKYYGHVIEKIVKKAAEYSDPEKQRALVKVLAHHMKKAYLMWNKDTVSDETIFREIAEISNGKIDTSSLVLAGSREILSKANHKRIRHSDQNDDKKRRRQ